MEDAYLISGGKKLSGEVTLSGSKNIALKVIIASLLLKGDVKLKNIPKIRDIEELINLIKILGGKVEWTGENEIIINGDNLNLNKIDLLHGSKIRVSFMLFAPLLHKFKTASIPNPGGCRIGSRSIDRSIDLMKSMDIKVIYDDLGYYDAFLKNNKPIGCHYIFEKPSHTGTEFAIMLAVLAENETIIENASLEPEIDELINFLNIAGAKIIRNDDVIVVKGVNELKQAKEFFVLADRNEAVTYAVLALATKGDITVIGVYEEELDCFLKTLKQAGGGYEVLDKNKIRFFYDKEISPTNITTKPHPGFMTDWQAPWAVLMTQASGESTIHETIFENRFGYVGELIKMGAKIEFFQPKVENYKKVYQFNDFENKDISKLNQAIKIFGKTPIHNGVVNVTDLRSGATLVIAGLMARGESVVTGASVIERGYENLDKKINSLGGSIKKI